MAETEREAQQLRCMRDFFPLTYAARIAAEQEQLHDRHVAFIKETEAEEQGHDEAACGLSASQASSPQASQALAPLVSVAAGGSPASSNNCNQQIPVDPPQSDEEFNQDFLGLGFLLSNSDDP